HNTSIMVGPTGELLGKYRKMHIPDDPRFYEKYYFTPGDLGWRVQTVPPRASGKKGTGVAVSPAVKTGMLVCWDQWYPEAARLTALRGAQVLFYPTAIGWYHGETPKDRHDQREAWVTMQ